MDISFFNGPLADGKVKVWFVCPDCHWVDLEIKNDKEVDPVEFDEVKKDEYGNDVYICEAYCSDCQRKIKK